MREENCSGGKRIRAAAVGMAQGRKREEGKRRKGNEEAFLRPRREEKEKRKRKRGH